MILLPYYIVSHCRRPEISTVAIRYMHSAGNWDKAQPSVFQVLPWFFFVSVVSTTLTNTVKKDLLVITFFPIRQKLLVVIGKVTYELKRNWRFLYLHGGVVGKECTGLEPGRAGTWCNPLLHGALMPYLSAKH